MHQLNFLNPASLDNILETTETYNKGDHLSLFYDHDQSAFYVQSYDPSASDQGSYCLAVKDWDVPQLNPLDLCLVTAYFRSQEAMTSLMGVGVEKKEKKLRDLAKKFPNFDFNVFEDAVRAWGCALKNANERGFNAKRYLVDRGISEEHIDALDFNQLENKLKGLDFLSPELLDNILEITEKYNNESPLSLLYDHNQAFYVQPYESLESLKTYHGSYLLAVNDWDWDPEDVDPLDLCLFAAYLHGYEAIAPLMGVKAKDEREELEDLASDFPKFHSGRFLDAVRAWDCAMENAKERGFDAKQYLLNRGVDEERIDALTFPPSNPFQETLDNILITVKQYNAHDRATLIFDSITRLFLFENNSSFLTDVFHSYVPIDMKKTDYQITVNDLCLAKALYEQNGADDYPSLQAIDLDDQIHGRAWTAWNKMKSQARELGFDMERYLMDQQQL